MYSINTFWSANNMIAERKLQDAISVAIQQQWKSKRYRRLAYYFFEKEIQSDTRKTLASDFMSTHHLLIDPEYQACIARSALGKSLSGGIVWDGVTFLVNNYIFRQDVFAITDSESDVVLNDQIIAILLQGTNPGFLNDSPHWMSDILLQCRRMRADVDLVQSICHGEHTYKSLLKACGEYIGQYAVLPNLFAYLGISRSTDSLLSLLEESTHTKLTTLLQPSYEVVCRLLSADEVKAYGYVSITDTPYTTWIGRLGYRWAHTPWYLKIGLSMMIVVLSGLLGGISLIILPIIWGIVAMARSTSQYLELLKNLLTRRYTHYSDYNTNYIELYDTMIDPDQSPKTSILAQKTMTHRYDVVPFSGHELIWDATQYAKTLFEAVISSVSSGFTESLKDVAMISSVAQRGKDNNLSLMVVQDGQYTEQVSYRFESLLALVESLSGSLSSELQYSETYDIIDELISTKKYNFWFRTYRDAIVDGVMVACSSGILGWMGSYLRNRSVTGSSAFAAGPGMITHTVTHSDSIVFDTELLSAMKSVMKPEDVTRFVDTLAHDGQSDTLWNTMVDLFGSHQGNVYTNHLMDQRWRVGTTTGESNLFESALHHGLQTSSADLGWTKMIHFLHRVYGYDNLQDYEILINKPWLSETLRGLKDGTISLEQFAQLDIKQREIITQAMFYTVPKTDLSGLFMQAQVGPVVDMSGSLSLGQKILDLLGRKDEQAINVVETGGKIVENEVKTVMNFVESGDVVVNYTGAVSSGWTEHLSSRWYNLTHPTYTITETGSSHLPDVAVDIHTGSLWSGDHIGAGALSTGTTTGQIGWFEQFITWLKGIPPVKTGSVDLSGLVNTGKIDQVLSGISPDDIQSQATGFAEQLANQSGGLTISNFTFPVLRRDKRVE